MRAGGVQSANKAASRAEGRVTAFLVRGAPAALARELSRSQREDEVVGEAEGLICPAPGPMLTSLPGRRSEARRRKLRLFAVACCRRSLGSPPDQQDLHALNVAEARADGTAAPQGMPTDSPHAWMAAYLRPYTP